MKRYWGWAMILGLTLWTNGCKEEYTAHPYEANISQEENATFIEKINSIRSEGCLNEEGIPDSNLSWNDALFRSAYEHAEDIRQSGKNLDDGQGSGTASDYTAQVQHLNHGSSLDDRLRNNGYNKTIAKEIATRSNGASTIDAILQKWTQNRTNCTKIMDKNISEFGMAHIQEANRTDGFTDFWVIDLGKPAAEDTWF